MAGTHRVNSLFTSIFIDLYVSITDPSLSHSFAVFSDVSKFYIIPLVGGYLSSNMYQTYMQDQPTYNNAGLNNITMYNSAIAIFKA